MIRHFWDEQNGGLLFEADDAETVLVRKKEIHDGAYPSGNSAAMLDLLRLSRMAVRVDFEEKAWRISKSFPSVSESPETHTFLTAALDFAFGPSYEVAIVGDTDEEDTRSMTRALRKVFAPNKVVLLRPARIESPEIVKIAGFTKYLSEKEGKATAYVCQNYKCSLPTTDPEEMLRLLSS